MLFFNKKEAANTPGLIYKYNNVIKNTTINDTADGNIALKTA